MDWLGTPVRLFQELMGAEKLCAPCSSYPANSHFLCASKTSLSPFCLLMKANTVQLPKLAAAAPSQQRGDRTDGPKLWDKASPNTPSHCPREDELGTEG